MVRKKLKHAQKGDASIQSERRHGHVGGQNRWWRIHGTHGLSDEGNKQGPGYVCEEIQNICP